MKNDKSIIERLEELSNYIDCMLDRPRQFAQTPEILEMSIYSVLAAWKIIIDSPINLRTIWMDEVKLAYPDSTYGYAAVSLGYYPGYHGLPETGLEHPKVKDVFDLVVYHMRKIWKQLKYHGGQDAKQNEV